MAQAPAPEVRQSGKGSAIVWNSRTIHTTNSRISNLRAIPVEGSAAVSIVWNEGSGKADTPSHYAISVDGQNVQRVTTYSPFIRMKYRTFDPLVSVPAIPRGLEATSDNELYLVQFYTQALPEYRAAIVNAGGQVWGAAPETGYFCRLTASEKATVAAMPFVRWIGADHPWFKLEQYLLDGLAAGNLPTHSYLIGCIDDNGAQKMSVAARIQMIGGTVENAVPGGLMLRAALTASQLKIVAGWNEIDFIDRFGQYSTDMDLVRSVMGANYVEGLTGYNGTGVAGEVMDGGYRATHLAFSSAPTALVRSNTTDTSHGSSTNGIVFGDGSGNANGRGMLPNGQNVFAAYTQLSGFGGSNNRYTYTLPLSAAPYFACFQSNSWGSPQTTAYTNVSRDMDTIIYDQQILILNSQSNTGNQNSRPEAWAKNVVSVGGISHFGTAALTDDNWTSASIGPAQDGRIKPDISFWYDSILCPTNTSDTAYTTSFGGTSAATPMTAGYFGIMYQMWHNGEFANNSLGATVFDNRPKPATAKALMTNLARQYPWGTNRTRYKQGWGLPDLVAVYDKRNGLFIVNESDVLANLQTKSYRLWVAPGTPEFHATMCYNDPAPTTQFNPARVNDLTLRVVAPDGTTTYFGNNGLTAGNYSTVGGVANTLDTLEHVIVQNPASGVWTVTVEGNNINTDARVETPGIIDADYGLVVSGIVHNELAESHVIECGALVSGTVANMNTSNNQYMVIQCAEDTIADDGNLRIKQTVTGTAPTGTLTSLRFRVESNGPVNTYRNIEFWNYAQARWDPMTSSALLATDSVVETGTATPAEYIGPGNQVKARVSYIRTADDGFWNVNSDTMRWFMHP